MKSLKKVLLSPFLTDSIKILTIRVIGIGLQYLLLLFLTNNLNEYFFGQYNYLTTIIIPLSAICLLGMDNSFLQFIGRLKASNNFLYVRKLYIKKIVILSVSFILIFSGYLILKFTFKSYFNQERLLVYNNALLVLYPFCIYTLNVQVIRGLDKLMLSEFFRGLIRFGVLIVLVSFLVYKERLDQVIVAFVVTFFLLAIISTIVVFKSLPRIKNKKLSIIENKEILKVSLPMSISFFSLLIMQSFDIIILEHYFGFDMVAFYGIAVKISLIVGIVLASINTLIAPKISTLYYKNDFNSLKILIRKSTILNFLITIPLIVLIIIFSENLLRLFGEDYVVAKYALIFILIGQAFNALCGSVGTYLNMTGRQKIFQRILILALLLNLILNFIFIPKYGMIGAAASTSTSLVFWNIIGVITIWKKDKINSSIFGIIRK